MPTGVVITISREYGAAGLAVATGVARRLDFELVTDGSGADLARSFGTSADVVAARTGREASLGERMLAELGFGTPELVSPAAARVPEDFDESLRRAFERTIRERAATGRAVFLGRNAGAVLGPKPDVVRVFLWAPVPWRAARLVEAFGLSGETAHADIERTDAARRKFAKDRFDVRWGDRRDYDLTLDVSRAGISGAADLVALAATLREPS